MTHHTDYQQDGEFADSQKAKEGKATDGPDHDASVSVRLLRQ